MRDVKLSRLTHTRGLKICQYSSQSGLQKINPNKVLLAGGSCTIFFSMGLVWDRKNAFRRSVYQLYINSQNIGLAGIAGIVVLFDLHVIK